MRDDPELQLMIARSEEDEAAAAERTAAAPGYGEKIKALLEDRARVLRARAAARRAAVKESR